MSCVIPELLLVAALLKELCVLAYSVSRNGVSLERPKIMMTH